MAAYPNLAEGQRNAAFFVHQDAAPGTAAVRSSYGKSIPYQIVSDSARSAQTTSVGNIASASNKAMTSTSYNATSLR